LPWELSLEEIQENVPDGLQIVSSGLFVTDMSIQTSVSSSSSKVLAISEGNVLTIGTLVALGQSKIDDVDGIFSLFAATDQKIIRLDISVDDSFFVNNLNPLYHLSRNVQNCFEIKLAPALLKEVFQTLAEHVHDHDVVHLAVLCLFVTHEMEVGNCSLAS